MTSYTTEKVNLLIREQRKNGKKLGEIAKGMGLAHNKLSDSGLNPSMWENPTAKSIAVVCDYFRVSPNIFFTGYEDEPIVTSETVVIKAQAETIMAQRELINSLKEHITRLKSELAKNEPMMLSADGVFSTKNI